MNTLLACLALGATTTAAGGRAPAQTPTISSVAGETRAQYGKRMRWWQEARFGMFVHWGPVSLVGTEIGWSRGGERRGTGGTGEVPLEVYDSLYRRFDPTRFDAKQWVAIAKAAGMRYLVFTTKHHDGFCEFDSKLTDYKVTNSPFRRDIVAELARACHEAGLRLGFYYSPPDWHHPDYRTADHARYVAYLHGQIRELLTNYGKVDVLWFDGLGGSTQDWDATRLIAMAHKLQPGIVVNNRAGPPADFDTPEQTIGSYSVARPWETCMTICQQWAWKPGDEMKSLKECLQTLVRCAGGDGNLLFNVGPMPTGEIEPRQVQRLREMGAWLGRYGRTIYDTRGGPFRPGAWGASTCRGNIVYLHVMGWPGDVLTLPALDRRIVSSAALTGGMVHVEQAEDRVTVTVPRSAQRDIDTIVALRLDGPAFTARTRRLGPAPVSEGKPARASNVFLAMPTFAAGKATDGNDETRWATDAGTHAAWIEIDLGAGTAVGRAYISEEFDRVRRWELQYQRGDEWVTVARGQRLGHDCEVPLGGVTARVFRLNILEATEGPTLWEFQLYGQPRPR